MKNNILLIVQGKFAALYKNFGFCDNSVLCLQSPPVPFCIASMGFVKTNNILCF